MDSYFTFIHRKNAAKQNRTCYWAAADGWKKVKLRMIMRWYIANINVIDIEIEIIIIIICTKTYLMFFFLSQLLSCNSAFSFIFTIFSIALAQVFFFNQTSWCTFFWYTFPTPPSAAYINFSHFMLHCFREEVRSIYGCCVLVCKIFARKEKVLKGERNMSHYYKGQVLYLFRHVFLF